MNADRPTSLYRHFAVDGTLLYVGISLSWPARTRAHRQQSQWFQEVARVEIEQFPSREAAIDAERAAILSERPKFNVVHNRHSEKRPKSTRLQSDLAIVSESALSLLSSKERRRYRQQLFNRNPLLQKIRGPHAIVGPALVYKGNTISVVVAHGLFGTAGELTELVLGELVPNPPEWAEICVSVITLLRADEITLTQARDQRRTIIETLNEHLEVVEAYDTDIALAVAYASQFPSSKSREVLDHVAKERGARA